MVKSKLLFLIKMKDLKLEVGDKNMIHISLNNKNQETRKNNILIKFSEF